MPNTIVNRKSVLHSQVPGTVIDPITVDLIAHYDFNEANTTALVDSINGYNGSLSGSGNLIAQSTGVEGTGWEATATSGAIVQFATATLKPQSTGVRSYTGWVYRTGGTVMLAVFSDTGNQRSWRLMSNSNAWEFSHSYDGVNNVSWMPPAPNNAFSASTRYFWALIIDHDNDVVKFSRNGNTLSEHALTGNLFASTANLSIFGRLGSLNNKISGWMDQMRVYSRELSQSDINAIYALHV